MAVRHSTTTRPLIRLIILLVALAFLMAACASGSGSTSDSVAAARYPADDGVAAPTTTAAPALVGGSDTADETRTDSATADGPNSPDASSGPGLAVPTALTPADVGRDIVFTATIDLEVADVAAAGAEARDVVLTLGGVVFAESTTTAGRPHTVLTFKIRPAEFDRALSSLSKIGELVNQRVSADDVTDRIVDLQSRASTAEASVVRLRKLLNQAGDVNALARLEGQLLERETLLEQLRGQLRTVKDQVALATITLSITQAPTVIPPAAIDLVAGLGTDATEACPGSLDLRVDRTDTVTLCVEIDNVGESALTGIVLESGTLRLRLNDFTVVEGNTDRLEPGERLILTTDLSVEDGRVKRRRVIGGLSIDVQVRANPVEATSGKIAASTSVLLDARNDKPLPGFADSFSAGAAAVGFVASIALIAFAGLLPLIPAIATLVLVIWWWRRRQGQVSDSPPEEF